MPSLIAPFTIGTTFGLASSPCITPVLATLLAWVSQAKNPTISVIFLFFFGIGQVTPLIIAGATADNLKQFLALRKFSQIIPTLSGIFLVSLGLLNLLGIIKFQFPNGPDLKIIEDKIPSLIAPFTIGTTFGLASSPCITPVLATLLAWVSQAKIPIISIIFLFFFGIGQVTPLIIAGATTENLKKFLELRKFSQIIPTLSGIFLVALGLLNLFSNWI